MKKQSKQVLRAKALTQGFKISLAALVLGAAIYFINFGRCIEPANINEACYGATIVDWVGLTLLVVGMGLTLGLLIVVGLRGSSKK